MKTELKLKHPKPRRGRSVPKPGAADMNQATGDEFEREGMGIAPKE
jgi:hypothetical protein